MHHHGVFRRVGRGFVPGAGVDFFGGEDAPWVAHEQLHDARFGGGEAHRVAVCCEGMALEVVFQPADAGAGPPGARAAQFQIAAQMAFYPGRQFCRAEGLCDIVVGADGEAQNLV